MTPDIKKRRATPERGAVRRFRPEPLISRPTKPGDPSNWAGLVKQLMGSASRTPYCMAMHRLNALNLAAAALRHAGEPLIADQVSALSKAVNVPAMT